jgi:type 1 glutamine amidotransferase
MGKSVNPDKPAIENPVAWTGTNSFGAKIFMTTLGHPEDFQVEDFQHLVINAVLWELGKKVPNKWKGKIAINVPYRGIVN